MCKCFIFIVGPTGLEPVTPWLWVVKREFSWVFIPLHFISELPIYQHKYRHFVFIYYHPISYDYCKLCAKRVQQYLVTEDLLKIKREIKEYTGKCCNFHFRGYQFCFRQFKIEKARKGNWKTQSREYIP